PQGPTGPTGIFTQPRETRMVPGKPEIDRSEVAPLPTGRTVQVGGSRGDRAKEGASFRGQVGASSDLVAAFRRTAVGARSRPRWLGRAAVSHHGWRTTGIPRTRLRSPRTGLEPDFSGPKALA